MLKLYNELKRRKVLTTLGVYGAAAFIIIQVAEIVFTRLLLPDWTVTFIIILVLLGFPVTFFLAWTFDLTRGSDSQESGGEDVKIDKKSKKILLPITGLLTIIGGVFWVWYSMGSMSQGSNLDNKIFQSIAVLYIDNLSSDPKDENICTGLTSSITTAFSRLGIFDVKPRTDVLQFKNKVTTAEEISSVLGVDAYIDGSLIRSPNSDEYIANIVLVDAQGGKNLWAKEFKKTSTDILNIPNIIVKEVTQFLSGDVVADIAPLYDVHKKGADETFSLLGQGINLLDSEEYGKSVTVFDSILVKEPDNRLALFSKGQALEGLGEYADAISKYEQLLTEDSHNVRTKQIWTHPELMEENVRLTTTMTGWLFSDELNMWIVALKNTKTNSTDMSVIDLNTNEIIWKKSFSLQLLRLWTVGKNLVVTGSSISDDENATVYIYDLQTRNLLMSKEFRKDYPDQRMILSVMNDRALNVPKYRNSVFLNIRRDDYYNIILLDPINKIERWKKIIPLQAVQEGSPAIHVIESENKHYVFHQKGLNLYLYSADDGRQIWTKTLSDDSDHVSVSFDRLISYSNSHSIITIQNIINQKTIGQFDLGANPDGKAGMINDNFILNTKNSVTSLKTEKPFLRSLENWTVNIDPSDGIGRGDLIFDVSDNIFVFTKSGDLYCLNPDNGKIININKLDADIDAVFIRDKTSKSFILYTNGFLIGLDPHNGKTLWKIRELNISNPKHRIGLFGNQVVVLRRVNNQIIFKSYARSTGDLLWTTNEKMWPDELSSNDDDLSYGLRRVNKGGGENAAALYIKTITNGLYSTDLTWNPNKHYIPKTDIYHHLAACYNKIADYKESERVLTDIIDLFDQQSEKAFTQLSDMYLSAGNVKSFIDIQAKFHELVLYDDIKRGDVEEVLIEHAGLGWVYSFQKEQEFAIQLQDEKMILVGACGDWDDGDGCTISAFRKHTGIELWKRSFNISKIKIITPEKSSFLFVGMTYAPDFEGENKAVLYRVDALTGETILEAEYWEDEERYHRPSKIYHFGTHYIIDVDVLKKRNITAINSETGLLGLELELDKDVIMRSRPVDIVSSDSLIIVPLDGELQAYNLYSGNMKWSYDYTDDIFGIDYLNQSGVSGGTISFLSDDDEYVVLDINTRQISFQENVTFNDEVRIQYLDANYILGYNNIGYIALFEKNVAGVKNVWTGDIGATESLILSGENIHVFGLDNYYTVNFQDGRVSEKVPFIWAPENIFIDNKYLSCFTRKKLYLIHL